MLTSKIKIPATTANLGSGFDVFGMALSLYNEAIFIRTDADNITGEVVGEGSTFLRIDENNLFVKSMRAYEKHFSKVLPGGKLRMINRIPLSRGLGSSSAAIVGGVYLANVLCGKPYSKKELLPLVIDLEGHPDNVAPALLGNFVASVFDDSEWHTISYQVPQEWKFVVASPNFPISTEEARRVLPKTISHKKAVQNVGQAAALLSAFVQDNPELLKVGFKDYLHVPYRLPLIKNGGRVIEAAIDAGAYAATISGSGSTLLAVSDAAHADAVEIAMKKAFSTEVSVTSHVLKVCTKGVRQFGT